MQDRRRDVLEPILHRCRTRGSRNETSDHEDKAIHPSWSGRRAHSIALRGVARTPTSGTLCAHGAYTYTYMYTHTQTQCRVWTWKPAVASTPWGHVTFLGREKRNGRAGSFGVVAAQTCPPGPGNRRSQTTWAPKMRLTIVQSAGNAARRTAIARACVRACVSRLAEFRASGRPAGCNWPEKGGS